MAQTRTGYKVAKKKKRVSSFLKGIGIVTLLIFLIGGGVFGYFILKMADVTASAQTDLERGEQSEKRKDAVNPGRDSISVLFLGVDDRSEGEKGRTDALIVATFNKDDHSIKMVSIPRDSKVEIVGKNKLDKINHAHAIGGVDMTIATVEKMLDIPIDYFAKLNFDAFIEIIDELGGIEVNSQFSFTEMDSKDNKGAIKITEGLQTLNGEEALAYARMRKQDPRGDIGRGERQQEVIKAIIEKGASMSSISKYDNVLDRVGDHLNTNLTFRNIVSLHSYSSGVDSIESLKLNGKDSSDNGIYYYELDPTSVQEISTTLKQHLNIK